MSSSNTFSGPTFRQRLLDYARAATVVTVIVRGRTYMGRVLRVDTDNFEMVLTHSSNGLPAGSILNISFCELDAISVSDP